MDIKEDDIDLNLDKIDGRKLPQHYIIFTTILRG